MKFLATALTFLLAAQLASAADQQAVRMGCGVMTFDTVPALSTTTPP